MPSAVDYQRIRVGAWTFWRLDGWSDIDLLKSLVDIADRQLPAKHPQTLPFAWPPIEAKRDYFLKVFHRRTGLARIKELLRWSKARRFWRQGLALAAAGFNVPLTVAYGEKRRCGFAQQSIVLTEKIDGQPVPLYLLASNFCPDDPRQLKMKWRALERLGLSIRRFHDQGFVHGDLVATNIFIAGSSEESLDFYLMDNDRTQRYPAWLTVHLRKRNLVQLNRIPLAHITLQDRMRFLRSYLQVREFAQTEIDFAVWLERRTRQRRHEVDGADTSVDFRRLMARH